MRISDWSADVCSSDLKIEAGRYEIVPAPFDPAEAARGAVQLMKGWADEGEVRLEACVPDRLPRAVADRRALRQILLNLLSNAIKFTPRGGRVTVSVEPAGEPAGRMIRFVVSDTGIGIPAADLSRLGQPFEQVEDRRSEKIQGTGLGLALSKSLEIGRA